MYLISIIFPLIGSLISGFLGRKIGSIGSKFITTSIIFICIITTIIILYEVILSQSPVHIDTWNWISTDTLSIGISFYFDPITIIIIIVVSIISSLVHLYSCWYIDTDPHLPRFISYLSAFTFFIIILVTGDNYAVLFLGWEGIGVLSFLLINFWITRIQASKAAIQAITVNRVGDIILSISFFACIYICGNLDYSTIFSVSPYINTNILNFIGILFILACAGKSAQIGLHNWLVNAIEGPTPVSSILHAATLVTAGIYLLIRSSPLLEYAPIAQTFILWIGSITCLFAATIGLLQNDLKRVIAFSTISQIGYLVIGVGLSQYNTVLLHLSGHAYFKALLFLAAGGVIHSIADEQDIRKIGGLINFLPFTYTAIFIGSLSLIAIFPLSGFYSKDIILELASGSYISSNLIAYILGTLTAGLTAFYSIRLISLTFITTANANIDKYNNTHDQPIIVIIPLTILIIFSIFYGYIIKEIFTSLGTDGLISSTFNLIQTSVDSEFQPLIYKLIPTIVTIFSAIFAIYLYNYNPDYLLRLQDYYNGRFIYIYFNGKWIYDIIINNILRFNINIGYNISQIIDRGILEIIGPIGTKRTLYIISNDINYIESGKITSYASYILISTISFIIFFPIFY